VHKALGPGLLESAYHKCLLFELQSRGLRVESEKPLDIVYRGEDMGCGYKIDIVVEGIILLELKSVDSIHPVHEAQIITYLKLSGIKLGFLINFNITLMKKGLNRFVNDYFR